MNSMELSFARQRKKRTQQQMAGVIKKSLDSYSKKERDKVSFSPDEIVAVTLDLELTFDQMNDIFFDGHLPFRKSGSEALPPTP